MMDVSMILDPDTCMYDAYIYPDTHEYDAHMYDAFIHDDWSWYMHVWCIYLCSSTLDSDACMYDGGSPGRDGAAVGHEQAYYEVGK